MRRASAPKLAWVETGDLAPRVIRLAFFLTVFMATGFAYAQAPRPPLSMSAVDSSLDLNTGETILRGNPRIQDEGLLLEVLADDGEIRLNYRTGTVSATGKIVLTLIPTTISPPPAGRPAVDPAGVRLLADHVVYDMNRRTFNADNIRLGSYPVFIEGTSASGTREQVTIEQARGTFGEPGKWQPTFFAERMIYEQGQLRTEKATLGIGEIRPVPLTRFEHDLTQPIAVTLALNGGFRASLGVFAEVDLHLPVSRSVRLGADISAYSRRGVMVGPSGRYSNRQDPDRRQGYFRSGYINDHGNREIDLLGRPVPVDRAYFEWQHSQRLADQLTLRAQLNWWKDSEVLRDFRPRSFYPVQAPDTFVESVYTGANYLVSAFARFQPNTFQRVQERLPEVRFDLLPRATEKGIYERFTASAAMLREDPPLGGTPLRATRLDAYYSLFRPSKPREWASITPVVGGRFTRYINTSGAVQDGAYTRLLGEVGVDAEIRASGIFAYQNELWKIDGLRHLLTPRLSYRYIPGGERGRTRIPLIDREVFSTYLPPLGLGSARNIDDLRETNTLRLGFDNTLQTRDPVHGSRDLLVLNVANDFRFRRRPGERDVSEVHAELAILPASWLQVDVYQSFAPQSFTLREFNSGLTVRDANAWSVRLANNYLRGDIQDYLVDGRVRLNEAFEALARLHYDARRRRLNEQSYGIVQNLGNTWSIAYTVNLYSGRRRESGFGFNVQIDTVRF